MDMWTDEHLGRQAFSSGEMVDDLLKQTEDLYTLHFGMCHVLSVGLWLMGGRTWRLEEGARQAETARPQQHGGFDSILLR